LTVERGDIMPDDETINEEFDQTGTHAFLFVDHVSETTTPEDVVRALRARERAQVLYASTFVGDFQAFAHLRVEEVGLEGIGKLQDLIEEIVGIGARCEYGVETKIQPLGAKRRSPGLIVLTRIQIKPGAEIREARDALIGLPEGERPGGFVGISLMSGKWTVLLQTTGDSVDEAHDNVAAIVAMLPGVKRTSTAFADGGRTSMRHPRVSTEG
jgi:DNA-binding Lrp family transcriptional regulator